jgi:ABC-2 type transport system ATP-binding protein
VDSPHKTTESDLAVSVHGLRKAYGDVEAVRGVDLEIRRGEIFALLGPNGAGKTSTIEILEGYRHRDDGRVAVLGLDPAHQRTELKSRIGIVLQSTGVDRYLTVTETITMFGRYYPHPRPTEEVIDVVGLAEKRDTRVLKLSGGQQRRLDVAIALVGDPELLFLDEPTTGFDPSARRGVWEVVKNLAALGKTVLLTTHYMDEAQYLADEVAVIASGQIVARGAPSTLGGRNRVQPVLRFPLPEESDLPSHFTGSRSTDGLFEFKTEDLTTALYELSIWAREQQVSLDELQIIRPTLEDVYLELTGPEGEAPSVEPARQKRMAR